MSMVVMLHVCKRMPSPFLDLARDMIQQPMYKQEHRQCLLHLLDFLSLIAFEHAYNKMSSECKTIIMTTRMIAYTRYTVHTTPPPLREQLGDGVRAQRAPRLCVRLHSHFRVLYPPHTCTRTACLFSCTPAHALPACSHAHLHTHCLLVLMHTCTRTACLFSCTPALPCFNECGCDGWNLVLVPVGAVQQYSNKEISYWLRVRYMSQAKRLRCRKWPRSKAKSTLCTTCLRHIRATTCSEKQNAATVCNYSSHVLHS